MWGANISPRDKCVLLAKILCWLTCSSISRLQAKVTSRGQRNWEMDSKSGLAPGSRSSLIQAPGNSLKEGHGTTGVVGALAQFLCRQVQYMGNTWQQEHLSTLATELFMWQSWQTCLMSDCTLLLIWLKVHSRLLKCGSSIPRSGVVKGNSSMEKSKAYI